MRMSTDPDRNETLADETIAAAAAAGVTVFDTARAYGHGDGELGHNERLLAAALRACGGAPRARIVTKGGMTRADGGWVPDGRAKALVRDCESSLASLDGLPIDLYLIHAPDPRTPWPTSVRALARLLDEGLVKHVGLSNVNRRQLDEALDLVPVSAVEVSLGPGDDRAIRGGVVGRCAELDIAVIAHSPLGGPRRAARLARNRALDEVARARGVTPAQSRSRGCSTCPRSWSRSRARGGRTPPGQRRARPRWSSIRTPGSRFAGASAARAPSPLGGPRRPSTERWFW